MSTIKTIEDLNISGDDFQKVGYELVLKISSFIDGISQRPVSPCLGPKSVKRILGDHVLPEKGEDLAVLLGHTLDILVNNSLFNGHPRFWGYITSSASPIGALADLISSAINANVGAFALSPIATEIERQTIKWLAEFIGYDTNCGGLFVSGGNMANFSAFLVARKSRLKDDFSKHGFSILNKAPEPKAWGMYSGEKENHVLNRKLLVYCSVGTHSWIQKAVDLFGHGLDSIRWVNCGENQQMDVSHLMDLVKQDLYDGHLPFMVIGNAGSVGTGTVDPLKQISAFCKSQNLWFHIDGAYGGPASSLPELNEIFDGLKDADSIALDPHKWLYCPMEAGCVLIKNGREMQNTFSFNPDYYNFNDNLQDDEKMLNYHEFGMQNSRNFKALKLWISFKQIGKLGYMKMIRNDISLANYLYDHLNRLPEFEVYSRNLSITTFRYVPNRDSMSWVREELNKLNEALLKRIQNSGEFYLSNAVINGNYCLRVCVVNFRSNKDDLNALVNYIIKEGAKIYYEMFPLNKVTLRDLSSSQIYFDRP